MERQKDLYLYLYEIEEKLPLQLNELVEKYNEDRGESVSKPQASRDYRKLKDRDIVKQPKSGHYDLTEKGRTRADRLKNPEKYEGNEPDGYADLVEELTFYIDEKKKDEYHKAVSNNRVFRLSLSDLERFSPEVVDEYEKNPESFNQALQQVEQDLEFDTKILPIHDVERLNYSIPEVSDLSKVGNPVSVEGTVEYATEPHGYLVKALCQCTNCGEEVEHEQTSGTVSSPYKCEVCQSRKFEILDKFFETVIEFRLSDATKENQSIKAVFRPDDIEESVSDLRPGTRLEVSGVLEEEEKSKRSESYTTYIQVHDYSKTDKTFDLEEVDSEEFDKVRDKVNGLDKDLSEDHPFQCLSDSIAPHIEGNDTIKQVCTASMLGASEKVRENHIKHDRIHSIIIGNPGTGKTEIMESALDLLPKSFTVDASNSTGVGLTATVEQEDGGAYSIRAGRLVQADKGYLGIDELDKMPEEDESKLNTALDKGMFTLDKASQHAELPGRATVIGVANYKEELDDVMNVKNQKPEWQDSFKDRFALEYYKPPQEDNESKAERMLGLKEEKEVYFDSKEVKLLVSMAREMHPELSKDASILAKKFATNDLEIEEFEKFTAMKSSSMRPLTQLIKLSCAFARSRLSEIVEERDMKEAIRLYCDANRRR